MKNLKTLEEMFEVAINFRDEGKFEDAIKEFLKIIATHPDHSDIGGVFTTLAGVYTDLNDYSSSSVNFKRGTELNPKSEIASLGLYVSYVELGRHIEAIAELIRYLEQYPAKLHKITLGELLEGFKKGYMLSFKDTITQLAKKNGVDTVNKKTKGRKKRY